MDPKLLTENGWKTTAQKSRTRDNGLQRALATYERLAKEKHEERLEALTNLSKLATNLRKVREVGAIEEVADYLDDMVKAAEAEKKRVAPLAARAEDRAENFKAWARKIKEADRQKPDF